MSLTTTDAAPSARAHCAASSPIGPAPTISTRCPATRPRRTACSATEVGSTSAPARGSNATWCANAAGKTIRVAIAPSMCTIPVSVRRAHRWRRPARQRTQTPQPIATSPTTRSPAAKPVTPRPTSTTVPVHSWPGTIGNSASPIRKYASEPSKISMSVPQIPTAVGAISSSPSPGVGSGRSTISSRCAPWNSTACIGRLNNRLTNSGRVTMVTELDRA